jgi:hypothetical protein
MGRPAALVAAMMGNRLERDDLSRFEDQRELSAENLKIVRDLRSAE